MNTKNIPKIIMLIAGAIVGIISIIKDFEILYSLKLLLLVLIVFYIIGIIAKKIIVKTITKNPNLVTNDDIEIMNDENNELQSDQEENKK